MKVIRRWSFVLLQSIMIFDTFTHIFEMEHRCLLCWHSWTQSIAEFESASNPWALTSRVRLKICEQFSILDLTIIEQFLRNISLDDFTCNFDTNLFRADKLLNCLPGVIGLSQCACSWAYKYIGARTVCVSRATKVIRGQRQQLTTILR